jgi:serine/threonine-protein kinase
VDIEFRTNVVGTLAYMAPERFSGTADGRANQYSLACVLYECLTGHRPFRDIDSAQQLRAHLMVDPPRAADRYRSSSGCVDRATAMLGRGKRIGGLSPIRQLASIG